MKLNKTHKEQIIKAIVQGAVKNDWLAVHAAEYEAAEAVRVAAFGGAEQCAMADGLPNGWLEMQAYMRVQHHGDHTYLYFGDAKKGDSMRPERRVPHALWTTIVGPKHDAYEKVAAWGKLHTAVVAKEKDLLEETRAVVNSCSTTNKLAERWPETKPYIEKYMGEKQIMPLSIDMAKLNKKLGLK